MSKKRLVLPRETHPPTADDLLFFERVDERMATMLAEQMRLDGELQRVEAERRELQQQIADLNTAIRVHQEYAALARPESKS